MTIRWLCASVLLLCAYSLGAETTVETSSSSAARQVRRPVVLGYYTSWNSALPPARIDYRPFTHLCHAFLNPDTSGGLTMSGNMPSSELTRRAHAAHVKVLISLGGAESGAAFSALTSDPAAQDKFVDAVVKLMVKHHYDGIDLDWEFPTSERERAAYTGLCRQFRKSLDAAKPGALLTAAVGGSVLTTSYLDAAGLLPYVDYMNIMAYDMHGTWNDHAGFNAPLHHDPADSDACAKHSVEGFMKYWTEELKWPKEKLLVGIPSYGRAFPASKMHGAVRPGDKPQHSEMTFRNIPHFLEQGWRRSWNEAAGVPSLSKEGVNEVISYDDEQSVALKGKWAAENGYPGVFFWEISQDYVDGKHVLVNAAAKGFMAASPKGQKGR